MNSKQIKVKTYLLLFALFAGIVFAAVPSGTPCGGSYLLLASK